jgi:hypothetical protein
VDAARSPHVVLSWWQLRGSLRVVWIRCFSPRRVECDIAVASRRRVLHGSGLLGAVASAFFDSYRRMVTPEVLTCDSASALLPLSSGVVVLLSRVRVELCVRIDVPIQPAGVIFIVCCAQYGRCSFILI